MMIICTDSSLATNMMVLAVEFLNWPKPNVLVMWFSYLAHYKLTAFFHATSLKTVMLRFTSKISC